MGLKLNSTKDFVDFRNKLIKLFFWEIQVKAKKAFSGYSENKDDFGFLLALKIHPLLGTVLENLNCLLFLMQSALV